MLLIHGPGHQQNMSANIPENRISAKIESDDESCSHCGGNGNGKKRRGISCATLLFLLAIDAFTIALLLILFYNLKHWSGNYGVQMNSRKNVEVIIIENSQMAVTSTKF